MKTTLRKILSRILALAMAFALFAAMPMTAYALDPSEAPGNLTASVAYEGITLKWTDNSNNEDGFLVERKESGENWGPLTVVVEVGENATSYTDTTAGSNKTYNYRVRAVTKLPLPSYSLYSNVVTASRIIVAPSNLTATAGAGGITLNWEDNTNIEIGFSIDRKEGTGDWDTEYLKVTANVTTCVDTTAETGKTYYYTVQAILKEGGSWSKLSNEASATMILTAMVAPSNLTATAGAGGYILHYKR